MIKRTCNGLLWHEFELLADLPIIHATFTRHGGHSSGFLESLNFGKSVGDNIENVQKNLKKASEALSLKELQWAKLCHGADVISISALDLNTVPICDALSTASIDLGLIISHADCQSAIFYDPIQHAIANVHCGWRGNVKNIYQQTVRHMQKTYSSKPENLLVCISPSLGPQNSEFINYKQELPESFLEFQFKPNCFDLWAISEWQLQGAGVLSHHIQVARIDTYSSDDYFSYRRSKLCGRQATICALKEPCCCLRIPRHLDRCPEEGH